jgi:hypothetical protein
VELKKLMRVLISTFRFFHIVFMAVLICCSVSGFAQEQYPTNLDLIRFITDSVVVEIINTVGLDSQQTLCLLLQKERDDQTELIITFICEAFQKQGYVLTFSSDTTTEFSLVLVISEAGIRFPSIKRTRFFGKRILERMAFISLIIRAVKSRTQLMIWSGEIEKSISDWIPYNMLPVVVSDKNPLGKASLPPKRGFSSWIEPCIVIATVAGLGYLFYSVRSQ